MARKQDAPSRKPDGKSESAGPDRRIPLTQLPKGAMARICGAEGLDPCDQFLLETLGLSPDTCVRVCKASGTCILEVGAENGHPSRIALAKAIADKVIVGPLEKSSTPGKRGA